MSKTITKDAFTALRWNYAGFLVRSGSNFLIGIFLARLLGPKPFGQLAAAMFVVGIANLLADAGFTSALIQAPKLTNVQIRYVFTLQFLIAVCMTAGCCAVSGVIARAFHDPAVRPVLLAISPLFILQAFGQTANALLRRELAFRSLQIAQISSYFIAYLGFGVPLALYSAGVWSLVVAQLVQAIVYAIWLYMYSRHSLAPTLESSGNVLLLFGSKTTASNLVNYGIANADNFVVGHVFGSVSLGFYNRAFTLASAPTDGIVGTLQQVLFAACSRAEGRLPSIRRAYLACLSAVGFLVLPTFWAMSVASSTVILGLYGEQWRPAAPLFRPLILALSVHALMAMAGPVLSSINLPQREIQAQGVGLLVALPVFVLASRHSLQTLAWGVMGAYVFRFFAMTFSLLRAVRLRWQDVLRALIGPAWIALLTTAAAWSTEHFLRSYGLSLGQRLASLFLTSAITFFVALILFAKVIFSVEFSELLVKGLPALPSTLARFLLRSASPAGTIVGTIAEDAGSVHSITTDSLEYRPNHNLEG